MLETIYTTKMSANKKTLQNRFTKIRSKNGRLSKTMALVMSVAIAVTMLCATVVMAAVGSDGLEHWDKNEVYFLAGVRGSVIADINSTPDWVKRISSDGEINVFIQRVDIRNTNGVVEHKRMVRLIGNLDMTDLIQTSTCGYRNENDENVLLVFDTSYDETLPYGRINPDAVYLKFLNTDDEDISYSGMDFEYFINKIENGTGGFIQIKNSEQFGDFIDVENKYWNSICVNYYTYFETVYKNRQVDGIYLSIVSCDNNFITIKVNVDIPEAYYLEADVCLPEQVERLGITKYYNMSEINGKEFQLDNRYSKNGFESGKVYVVNYVLKDRSEKVIYRQQDYVTIS